MIYNKKEEREQLIKAVKIIFAEFDTNLAKLCLAHPDLDKGKLKRQLFGTCYIHDDDIHQLVHKIAPDRFIQLRNGKWVIGRKV